MSRLCAATLIILLGSMAYAADPTNGQPANSEMKTLQDKASYSIGLSIGRNMKQQGFSLDIAKLAAGIADGISGTESKLSEAEIRETMQEFEKEHTAQQAVRAKAVGEKNLKEGADFLAANAKKEGVVTTKSGLQYKIIAEGKGKKPAKTDNVTTHYRGRLLDGTEFDSSIKRGEPATFPVGQVIPGWTEALQLMPVGSKWEVYVPSNLGYGAHGAGGEIGPNATLVFEIELLDIPAEGK